MDYYAIGQRIRKIRKAHKLSQETLSERIGISVTHMSHIETGNTKLSLPVLVDLAAVLEVRVDDLLYDNSPMKRNASIEAIIEMLDTCTTPQIKVIEDLVKAAKISLNQQLLNWKQHEKSSPFPESNWKWTAFLTGSANVQQACQLQIERRVLRAPEQGQLPYPPRRFLPVWAEALRGMRSSGAHRPRTVRPPRPRPGQARPHRRGIRQRPFACHRFFQSTRETATHRRKACRPVYFSRYHMPPCPPEKLLLAFKYTRPGVVTVNSSILSLRAAKQPQQNRTCCGFAWFNVLKALCASTGACALHTRGPRKRRV